MTDDQANDLKTEIRSLAGAIAQQALVIECGDLPPERWEDMGRRLLSNAEALVLWVRRLNEDLPPNEDLFEGHRGL